MTILESLPSPHPSLPARPPPTCNGSFLNGSHYQPSARIPSRSSQIITSGSSSPLSYSNSKPPPPAPDPPSLDNHSSRPQGGMPLGSSNSAPAPAGSQWLFSEEELSRTPSILDGMPAEQERENRSKGVNFITQVGIMLKLPQLTLATASVFLHRFYMRYSMVEKEGRPTFHYYVCSPTHTCYGNCSILLTI
jgi:hypothetical protein